MEHLLFHECERFTLRGIECPFRDLTKEEKKRQREREKEERPEEAEERDEIPVAIPARREQDKRHKMTREQQFADMLKRMPVIAHGDPKMKEALERMLRTQEEGGLPSIPREAIPRRGFPLPELEGRGLIAVLSAIAIFEGLRQLRSTGSGTSSRAVRASELRAASGFNKLLGTSGRGAGGFLRQADRFRTPLRTSPKVTQEKDTALKRLLGFSLGKPQAGFDEFSETGF